jgi:hypothetical protein
MADQAEGPAVRKCFCEIGRSDICLVLFSQRHFMQIIWSFGKTFAQEINFPQSQNFTVLGVWIFILVCIPYKYPL